MTETMMSNNEILFLYDAKLTNPNGDPDDENRPRMDGEREINLVTDLRLKRYIRDYFESKKSDSIYVRKINDVPVVPGEVLKKDNIKTREDALKTYADVRLFGATMAVSGNAIAITGAVQFNWGYSLNKVEVLEAAITSHFASSDKNKQGAIGRDYRVRYSFIAFSGAVSGLRAVKNQVQNEDLQLMDAAMLHAIPAQFTRSKIGQTPRLYLRVEYKDNETFFGDWRRLIALENNEELRDIAEVRLDVTKLAAFLAAPEVKEKISKIYGFCCSDLLMTAEGKAVSLADVLGGIPFEEVK